jgi:hypothetical protein
LDLLVARFDFNVRTGTIALLFTPQESNPWRQSQPKVPHE